MNDFTKHELILLGQMARRECIASSGKTFVDIVDKIQSMIESLANSDESLANSEGSFTNEC